MMNTPRRLPPLQFADEEIAAHEAPAPVTAPAMPVSTSVATQEHIDDTAAAPQTAVPEEEHMQTDAVPDTKEPWYLTMFNRATQWFRGLGNRQRATPAEGSEHAAHAVSETETIEPARSEQESVAGTSSATTAIVTPQLQSDVATDTQEIDEAATSANERDLPDEVVYSPSPGLAIEKEPEPTAAPHLDPMASLYELEPDELPEDIRDASADWATSLLKREATPDERLQLARRLVALQRSPDTIARAVTEDHALRDQLLALVADKLPEGPSIYAAIAHDCKDTDLVTLSDGSVDAEHSHPAVEIAGALADDGMRDELVAMIVDDRDLSCILLGYLIQGSETIDALTSDEREALLATVPPDAAPGLQAVMTSLSAVDPPEPVEA
jgi:hypothetical protein